MAFDVQEHMGDLPRDRMHFGREIETRTYELSKISILEDVLKYATKNKLKGRDSMHFESSIRMIAQDIDHLNTTRFSEISSGGNAEILARLVGADILTDFPDVKDAMDNAQEVEYSIELISNKRSRNPEIKLHTEFTRRREDFEGYGGPVTTVADFKFSKAKLESRKKELNEQVKALYTERNKVLHPDDQ